MLPVAQPVDFVGKVMTFVLVTAVKTSQKIQISFTLRRRGGIRVRMQGNVDQGLLRLMELIPRAIPTLLNSVVAPNLGSVGRVDSNNVKLKIENTEIH